MSYVILNPANDLLWSARAGEFGSERRGEYTTYATEGGAKRALVRTHVLRGRGCVVAPEPAHERALKIEELRATGALQ